MLAILVLGVEAFEAVQIAAVPDTTTVPLDFGKEVVRDGAKFIYDYWK